MDVDLGYVLHPGRWHRNLIGFSPFLSGGRVLLTILGHGILYFTDIIPNGGVKILHLRFYYHIIYLSLQIWYSL